MEIRPPCAIIHKYRGKYGMTGNATHDIVVLAADSLGGARVASADAHDRDGRAGEADKDVDALDNDAEQAEEASDGGVRGLIVASRQSLQSVAPDIEHAYTLHAVAALDGARRARIALREGGGGRKNREGSEGEGSDAREHHCVEFESAG